MSIEERMASLEAAVRENTAALVAGKGGSSSTAAATATAGKNPVGRPKKDAAASKHTSNDVQTAVVGVKDTLGTEAAKQIIADAGAKNLADLLTKPDKFDATMAACEAALAATGDESTEDEI